MSRNENNLMALARMGISDNDARALRRISMTLRRWHELECGSGNDHYSFAIKRDEATQKPYIVRWRNSDSKAYRVPTPDRERGALKRLAAIMARYPALQSYVQGDPRGCALYLLRPGDVPAGEDVGSYYSRGVAVY